MSKPKTAGDRGAPGRESAINRFSAGLNSLLVKGLSNLRLSLTLRIAMHYAWQLLRTAPLMLLAMLTALCVAQLPTVNAAMDALSQTPPAQENRYAQEQLTGLPVVEAYLTDQLLDDGVAGWPERLRLLLSDIGNRRISLYANTVQGGLVAVFSLDRLLYTASLLFWALVCADLYRVAYLLRKRNRLSRKVLKPIQDMADTAAKLSANNLSDRISVEGTKNELKDLALVINGMLDRIELSYNSQKQFVSDASHELRTPIAVIQGYAGMLERWGKTDPAVLDEGITAISQEATSMKELVERLLFLARHDKKTLMLEMEVFDPLEVLSEVHREAKMLSTAHAFTLESAQNLRIYADKGMIKQLMRILVDNAIKYTPAGGSVSLSLRRDGAWCVMAVSDTGPGISGEDLPRIFDRFYRCDDARKRQSSGHGLGLSIARIIVTAHGGRMKVRSKLDVGTTFSALLPLRESPPDRA